MTVCRTSPVVTAFSTTLDVKLGWTSGLDYPITTMNVQLDPISIFVGPQNILCVQQVHAVFQEYFDVSGPPFTIRLATC